MTPETVDTLILAYGLQVVFIVSFLSCLAVPLPASLVFMAAGTYAATGELSVGGVWLAGLLGAVLGDNTGYLLARAAGNIGPVARFLARRDAAMARAREYQDRHGRTGIFLSRWLVSPLGPAVNAVAGLGNYPWPRFFAYELAGEIVWVTIYGALGYFFSASAQAVADIAGTAVLLILSIAAAVWLGRILWRRLPRN
ncbi:MAG: DedA family protein [Flavobacteriaceae bacterium]